MAVDLRTVKVAATEVGNRLDRRNFNDLEPSTTVNPTAENNTADRFYKIAALRNSDTIRVQASDLWETERASVRQSEENE